MYDYATKGLSYFDQLCYIIQLKKHQWRREDQIKERQEKKIRSLIKHVYKNVQFYRDLFDSEKIRPDDIKTVEDLKKIPIITKQDVQDNYPHKTVAKGTDLKKCHIIKTTGSSGTPLGVCFDNKDYNYRVALYKYIYLESGVRWFDKIVTIRAPTDKREISWLSNLNILTFKNISIFKPLDDIINELITINPDFIITYPSMLTLLATEIRENKISGIRPRFIIAISETLTNSMRKRLSEDFNSEIVRHYGSEEFGSMAFECKKHSGYHIISDHVIMEFLKDGKDVSFGESGEVVITGLSNHAMPLIRYKIGDIAIPLKERCSCGRGWPLIKEVEGRQDDYLLMPSGKIISPRMINVIENIPGIKAYKTIQENRKKITVKLVKNNHFSNQTISEIKKQIKIGCLGENIEVDVVLTDKIPTERSGKIRTIVSNIKE